MTSTIEGATPRPVLPRSAASILPGDARHPRVRHRACPRVGTNDATSAAQTRERRRPNTRPSETVEGIVDEDRDESLVRISGTSERRAARARRLGRRGSRAGSHFVHVGNVGPGAAEAAAAPASSPAPIAEIAAASPRDVRIAASSIVGYPTPRPARVQRPRHPRPDQSIPDGPISWARPARREVARAAAVLGRATPRCKSTASYLTKHGRDPFYALLELKTAGCCRAVHANRRTRPAFGTLTQLTASSTSLRKPRYRPRPHGQLARERREDRGPHRRRAHPWPRGPRRQRHGHQRWEEHGVRRGGIKPGWLLPVQVDNGTNNTKLLRSSVRGVATGTCAERRTTGCWTRPCGDPGGTARGR